MANETTIPTARSASGWTVGLAQDGKSMEVRIALRSKDELRAWAAWCFENCGAADDGLGERQRDRQPTE